MQPLSPLVLFRLVGCQVVVALMQFYFISYVIWLTEVGQLFYLTTHDYVVILCVPPTFAIPAFVVVVWAREVSPFSRRKASVYVQAVVW